VSSRGFRPVRVWFARAPERRPEAVELVFDDEGVRFVFLNDEGAESVEANELPVDFEED
jgi:hypothetical protein